MKNKKEMNWPDDFINKIICGDSLSVMKKMPDESIDMAMTSPPYWGLRDYGIEQIFGNNEHCEHDFGIIHRRAGDKSGPHGPGSILGPTKHAQHEIRMGEPTKTCSKCQAWKGQIGLESTPEMYIKHLTEIFNEVKRVLKKEGTLWLNIGDTYGGSGGAGGDYNKGGLREGQSKFKQGESRLQPKCLCMIPERLAWSLIQNGWILRNKIIWYKPNAMPSSVKDRFSNRWEHIFLFSKSQKYYFDLDAVREAYTESTHERMKYPINKIPRAWADKEATPISGGKTPNFNISDIGKNPGDVFEINTQPFPEAHFAVFPEKLCEKPIKAGCPEGGIVLDPFAGAGTVLYVAKEMRRRFIGIDIKKEYCELAEKRLAQGVL